MVEEVDRKCRVLEYLLPYEPSISEPVIYPLLFHYTTYQYSEKIDGVHKETIFYVRASLLSLVIPGHYFDNQPTWQKEFYLSFYSRGLRLRITSTKPCRMQKF